MADKVNTQTWVEVDVREFTPVIQISLDLYAADVVRTGLRVLANELGEETADSANYFAQLADAIDTRFAQVFDVARELPGDGD